MKKIVLLVLISTLLIASCGGEKPAEGALDKDTSYAFGMFVANQIGFSEFSFDYGAFMEGFRDYNEDRETRLTPEEAMEKINAAVTQLRAQEEERMRLEGETNLEEGEVFMAENGARSGVITTASGLQYEVLSQGSGARPGPRDVVRVNYEGTLIDGTVFDSSYERGEPIEFPLDGVIPGWTEGVQLMNVGSTFRFVIPSDLAYGSRGTGGIPPNSTLIFKVELLSIIR
jgi:FKBP-type peptidyl-prolyl cis-trans isomerase